MALIKKFRIKTFKEKKTILKLDKISMFYNKRQILNNLNLDINKQEILGMLGPNGVGKSTIFQIITGLKDPSFGKVLIEGIDCTNIPIYERATKFKLGYVPQYGGFIQDLTLYENLNLVGEIQTWPAFLNLFALKILTATSTSASPQTIAGECPPSSIVTLFI